MDSQPQPAEGARPPLPLELRAATREKHHALNLHIMAHLPLALPPQADGPFAYGKGMAGFGQIFLAFEKRLTMTLAAGRLDQRILDMYEVMHLPQMLRTEKLRNDITSIKEGLKAQEAEELDLLAKDAEVFAARIDEELAARPHVMFAYCWSMYLALFNGGRVIQKLLSSPGSDFWGGDQLPLSFWDFEGDAAEDERLKNTCKERFLVAASMMTDSEKDDVIEGTNQLFDLCTEIVAFLDDKMEKSATKAAAEKLEPDVASSNIVGSLGSSLAGAYASLRDSTNSAWGRKAVEVDN